MDLEERLEKEREDYIRINTLVRQIAGKHLVQRGLPVVPDEREVQGHLHACRMYYEMYGTTKGYDSPWIEAFNDPNHFSNVELRRSNDDTSKKS